MKFHLSLAAACLLAAAPAFADSHGAQPAAEPAAEELTVTGDAAAGEKAFRQCAACH
ncbi:hypothetical protein HA397_31140, partial [Escherichia coli]|nr:hypothetical protein [Escherichia coli]